MTAKGAPLRGARVPGRNTHLNAVNLARAMSPLVLCALEPAAFENGRFAMFHDPRHVRTVLRYLNARVHGMNRTQRVALLARATRTLLLGRFVQWLNGEVVWRPEDGPELRMNA